MGRRSWPLGLCNAADLGPARVWTSRYACDTAYTSSPSKMDSNGLMAGAMLELRMQLSYSSRPSEERRTKTKLPLGGSAGRRVEQGSFESDTFPLAGVGELAKL